MIRSVFQHTDTKVRVTITEKRGEFLASVSVSRDLADEILEWNDCWKVNNKNEGLEIASQIAADFGLDKFYLVKRPQCIKQDPYSSFFPLPIPLVFLDLNPLHEAEGSMAKIIKLGEEQKIHLLVPYTVRNEMNKPNSKTPIEVLQLGYPFLYTCPLKLTAPEQAEEERFITLSRGNSKIDNVNIDLSHVFEAARYHANYFITRDKRLMSKTRIVQIKKRFSGLCLMTPDEFVAYIETSS